MILECWWYGLIRTGSFISRLTGLIYYRLNNQTFIPFTLRISNSLLPKYLILSQNYICFSWKLIFSPTSTFLLSSTRVSRSDDCIGLLSILLSIWVAGFVNTSGVGVTTWISVRLICWGGEVSVGLTLLSGFLSSFGWFSTWISISFYIFFASKRLSSLPDSPFFWMLMSKYNIIYLSFKGLDFGRCNDHHLAYT